MLFSSVAIGQSNDFLFGFTTFTTLIWKPLYSSTGFQLQLHHIVFVSDEGEVFSWGNNEYNQLATTTDEEQVCIVH